MNKLIKNANNYVEKALKEKSTIAYNLELQEKANKGHETVFANSMQNYVTRIGIILANCYSTQLRTNTYLGSIEFICKSVLKDNQLYKLLRAIDINDSANDGKHTLKNVNLSIKECLHQYNTMIKKIINTTKLYAFEVCYISIQKKVNLRDVPIVDENKAHVFGNISGVNYQIKLCPDYNVDVYKKTINSKITIYWPDANKNSFISLKIINLNNKRLLASRENVSIEKENSKIAIPLNLTEADLDRRVLYCKVELKLLKKVEKYYETGFIFKKEHSYVEYNEKATRIEKISQFYNPKNCK